MGIKKELMKLIFGFQSIVLISSIFISVCVCVCVLVSRVRLFCHPTDYSVLGSFVHGISQAWILEWVAFPSPGDHPKPGIKPVSPALAGKFFTTKPPGKSLSVNTSSKL